MTYGDYTGPDKPDKGTEGGSCNRRLCQAPGAIWFNHGSHSWYCPDCRSDIENDEFNRREWERHFYPKKEHPMFETREMIDSRAGKNADIEHMEAVKCSPGSPSPS